MRRIAPRGSSQVRAAGSGDGETDTLMNAKAIIPLVAGLIVGGLALKLGLTKLNSASGAQVQMVQVWAARSDIPRGTTIDESMLTAVAYPAKSVPTGAFSEKDKEKLLSRVPRIGAPANLPILESMLLAPGEQAGIYVPEGYRAVAVKVDESSGVGRHLLPGCHVDVIGFFNVRGAHGKAETISRTIIENVEVAAVGERISAEQPNDGASKSKQAQQQKPANAITLLVKPEQVPILHSAEQQGKLKLSMRGKADTGELADRRMITSEDVIGQAMNEKDKNEKGSLAGALSALFASKDAKDKKPAVQPQVVVAQPPPPPPRPAWVMRIVNGSAEQTFGWNRMTSMEPQLLDASGTRAPSGKSAGTTRGATRVAGAKATRGAMPNALMPSAPLPIVPAANPTPSANEQPSTETTAGGEDDEPVSPPVPHAEIDPPTDNTNNQAPEEQPE